MRITRGSNFHDEEQQLGAQSGVKQGSLKRRGSGFVSTVTPLSSLPAYPRVLEESLFSMTIEFRCAKVRRKKSRNRFPPDIESSPSSLAEESPDSARLSSFLSLSSVSFVTKVDRESLFPKNPSFSARSAQGKRLSLFRRDILVEKPFDRSLNLLLPPPLPSR